MSGVGDPTVYVVENFVIEAYKTIHEVPYATISERRGERGEKVERGRGGADGGHVQKLCGICLITRAGGESWVTCDNCEHAFHSECMLVLARDTTSVAGNGNAGDGNKARRCPRCIADCKKRRVASAEAVARLRTVLKDVHERPTLPAKLQLKLLGLPAPAVVTCALTAPALAPTLTPKAPLPCVQRLKPCSLPPKRRPIANAVSTGAPSVQPLVAVHLPPPPLQSQPAAVKLKRVSSHKRRRSVRDLTEALTPISPDFTLLQEAPRHYALATATGVVGCSKHGMDFEGDAPHAKRRLATVSSPSPLRPPLHRSKKVVPVFPGTVLRRKSNVTFSPACSLIPATAPVAGFVRKQKSAALAPPASDLSFSRTDVRY